MSIFKAIENDNIEEVKHLTADKNNLYKENRLGDAPIHVAVKKGYTHIVRSLLKAGTDANLRNRSGATPLHLTPTINTEEVITLLVQSGADIESRDLQHGYTPLDRAAVWGEPRTVETLIKLGADIDAKDRKDWTPAHKASFAGNTQALEVLIKAGANLRGKVKSFLGLYDGYTPVHIAAERGHADVIKAIVGSGVNIDIVDEEGHTPLYRAVFSERAEAIRTLMALGAKQLSKYTEYRMKKRRIIAGLLGATEDYSSDDAVSEILNNPRMLETIPIDSVDPSGQLRAQFILISDGKLADFIR